MKIGSLEWDDKNVEHIGKRATPAEVEAVCFEPHIAVAGKNDRYNLYGQTDDGRYLRVVLECLGGTRFRPITAFNMNENEKRKYRRRFS